ncbi:hypothetical protein GCM10027290_08970 [Micromonospora sonneratiae]|uniref:Uncharacterized protein n=1 Tax=Micromonospora sonneratiae TaxID=1184706 RepID=A0ABW3YET4_9ACTN
MTINDDHTWTVRSRHRTSDGLMSYQSCHCGLWRVVSGAGAVIANRVSTTRDEPDHEEQRGSRPR